MKYVALIPIRGGSKSIPWKNIRDFGGKPLCAWVIESACNCPEIEEVWVSTDSEKIKIEVSQLGLPVKIIDRPAKFATDNASTESVMLHFAEQCPAFDALITIQVTSPFLTSSNLSDAIMQFEQEEADSLLTATRIKRFFWSDDGQPLNYDPKTRPMRQQWEGTLMENGAFYITKSVLLQASHIRLGGKISIYDMSDLNGADIEIDEPKDWVKAENHLVWK